ncbi:acyltransferase [Flavobacterium sp. MAH-1]|uniref:Acyltransferase n=1 Tax=Flavobacterium agri TaxID=2743471 RepID=A0A7Y8Y1Q3_9FLAO|nr:acyltransferase [Flavobacterium agri]NUY80218.1 acyltransferase [Flavobacterium agri]NYA70243.1 acyltransferase [Flavobacterium agri]
MSETLKTKPHFPILDGLRGVAAIMVVIFHLFETHATSHQDQIVNHGYLAVDFFFLLSGFVIGYAYDDRWHKMSVGDFFKRRLIRLQPMVIVGMLIGGALFYFQQAPIWPNIAETPIWKMILVMLIGCTLLPLPLSMDIRGWTEMHPLNGPGWSLFYEYIANILYALGIRKFSKTALTVLVVLSGTALAHYVITSPGGDIVGGWALTGEQMRIGFSRVMFPFFGGLLLFRISKLAKIPNAFFWSSLLVVIVLAFPRVGGTETLWLNGVYEAIAILLVFPLIVYIGASGSLVSNASKKTCKFLGEISYPIYITHYPLIYVYTAWVSRTKPTLSQALPYLCLTFVSAVVLAYVCLRFYDIPVRKWFQQKFQR